MSVERGTAAMLMRRREILAQGAQPIGWKVGFNLPEIQEKLGIDAPLAGFLTTDTLVEDEWDELPVLVESEVAVKTANPIRNTRRRPNRSPRRPPSSRKPPKVSM